MQESNIPYLGAINLNKGTPYRFKDSEGLAHLERHFSIILLKNIRVRKIA